MLLELLLGIVVGLLVLCAGLLAWLLRRSGHDALLRVTARLEALREAQERITRAVVDEIGFGRRELAQTSGEQRAELARALDALRDALLDAGASDAELRKCQLAELDARVQREGAGLQQLLEGIRHDVRAAHEASEALLVEQQLELQETVRRLRADAAQQSERDAALAASAHDVREALAELGRALAGWLEEARGNLAEAGARQTERTQAELAAALDALGARLEESASRLGEAQARERGALATAVESALGAFHADHAHRLERIRQAVEERLPAALDGRLGDALRPATLRLDELRRVLDELRALAAHPGSLRS